MSPTHNDNRVDPANGQVRDALFSRLEIRHSSWREIMKTKRSDDTTQSPGAVIGRRKLLQLSGASLAAMGFASMNPLSANAQDLSNGANNFYTSDKVTMRKV